MEVKQCYACKIEGTSDTVLIQDVYLPDGEILPMCYLCQALIQSALPSLEEKE